MKTSTLSLRILFNIIMFSSVLFFPWWFTFVIAVFFLFFFDAYEVLFWGFLGDVLYGNPVPLYFNVPFLLTLVSLLLFFVVGI